MKSTFKPQARIDRYNAVAAQIPAPVAIAI